MATSAQQATSPIDERPSRDPIGLRIYEAIVAVPVIVAAVWIVASDVSRFANIALLYWVGVISIVELLPVQGWRDLNMTLAEPLLWGFALIAPARVAFVVAFVAAADPREFRREIGVGRALFNRAQLAVSILVCSVLFRELGGDTSHWERLLPLAIAVASIARGVNMVLVAKAGSLKYRLPQLRILKHMRIGTAKDSLLDLIALGVLAALLARLYTQGSQGQWAVIALLVPLLILGRQTLLLLRSAENELGRSRQREDAIRALSQQIADERQDERSQIAGDLHDEVVTTLMHINLLANAGKAALEANDSESALASLWDLKSASAESLEILRAVISELRESPLEGRGLGAALHDLAVRLRIRYSVPIEMHLVEFEAPEPVQVLIYQIAREAIRNSVLHSGGTRIILRMQQESGEVMLLVEDDGHGFDETNIPKDHFGLQLMQERAIALGGDIRISSTEHGTSVVLRCRARWTFGGAEESD